MKRRIFAVCMAMCTMAMVMFTGTTGNAVNVYAAADVTDSTIYAGSGDRNCDRGNCRCGCS